MISTFLLLLMMWIWQFILAMPCWWTFWLLLFSLVSGYKCHSYVQYVFGINSDSLGTSQMTWRWKVGIISVAIWFVDIWENKPTLVRSSGFFRRTWKSLFEKAQVSVFVCILHTLCKTHGLGLHKWWWARIGDQLASMFHLKAKGIWVTAPYVCFYFVN